MRQGHFDGLHADRLQRFNRFPHGLFDVRVQPFREIFFRDAHRESLDVFRQRRRKVRERHVGGGGVHRIVPADDVHQNRRVFRGFGHRADLVERRGERYQSEPRHPAISRFKSGDPAERRRLADGAAGIASQCGHAFIGRHRRARPAAGAAGHAVQIPRVVGDVKIRVLVGRAHGELVHVGFTDQHRPGVFQSLDDRRVVGRDEIFKNV